MASPRFNAEIKAKGVARSSFSVLALLDYLAPCPYEEHRISDWRRRRLDGRDWEGPEVCGVCHPPLGVPAELVARGGELLTEPRAA